ncbi:trypsin-like serine protease [Ramicandelaber brevisporus]|nr:trypsin-like serine protease [Ramicandelaber brevisporus]
MKQFSTTLLTVAAAAAASVGVATASPQTVNRAVGGPKTHIIGGTPVKSGEYPFIFALYYQGQQQCGGSILSPDWFLTAAHCVVEDPTKADKRAGRKFGLVDPSDYSVGVGSLTNSSSVTRNVKEVFVNPYYNPDEMTNDIALLKLDKPIDFIANGTNGQIPVQPAKIDSRVVKDTDTFEAAGWGLTVEAGSETSDTLLRVQVKALDAETCKKERKSYKDQNVDVICTGKTPGRDTCQGDSGGPLTYVSDKDVRTLVGLTSYANGECGGKDTLAFYTHIHYQLPFITAVTKLDAKNLVLDSNLKETSTLDKKKYNKNLNTGRSIIKKGKGGKGKAAADEDDDNDDDDEDAEDDE